MNPRDSIRMLAWRVVLFARCPPDCLHACAHLGACFSSFSVCSDTLVIGLGGRIAMAENRSNELWDVRRLLLIAVRKESPTTCPMARIPWGAHAGLSSKIVDFLRVPWDRHLHPPAAHFCRICFTSVCDACESKYDAGVERNGCACGVMDLRSDP